VPPTALRRLSPVLRMGLTSAIECKNQIDEDFDSIVVGTSLGCLRDTEKFLVSIHTATSDFLSPTPFIQSTHNTIGGQISLGLNSKAYNMTHTQNNVSFEVSLLDAIMCINEGKERVLVGAADEHIDFLKLMQPSLIRNEYPLSSGSSFFVLSNKSNKSKIGIQAVHLSFSYQNLADEIDSFLEKENIPMNSISLLLHSDSQLGCKYENIESVNYLKYTGMYFSASSFALHIAHDYLKVKKEKYALIVNDMCPDGLGLTLLVTDEA